MSVRSELITLNEVVENGYFFNVPIYQRLYVWGKEQIETLLNDLWDACQADKDVFYLGGTLVVERGNDVFDLIDGQQRFTTLWLISLAWSNTQKLSSYRYTKTDEGLFRHRISFAIRPQVQAYFDALIKQQSTDFPEARHLDDALEIIENFTARFEKEGEKPQIDKLSDYIFTRVKMILTRVPAETDLNKLFEVINNRGVQLQHHEILKARLLAKIESPETRDNYSILWDACAGMGDYVEKNLRQITGLKISELFSNDASKNDDEQLGNAKEVLKAIAALHSASDTQASLSLYKILAQPTQAPDRGLDPDITEEYEADNVRSIISFPMLLQHVLRIWLYEHEREDIKKILDKDLLHIFEASWLDSEPFEEDVMSFIEMLWEIRYWFDKYIIKWVTDEEEEVHAIRKLWLNKKKQNKNTYFSLVRQKIETETGFALLQSMLYHSQQITTHYWLTPLLNYIRIYSNDHDTGYYRYLRQLDNQLLCANDARPLIERTWELIKEPFKKNSLSLDILKQPEGTKFPHYWFYKLEFILWYRRDRFKKQAHWESFRMTAKNSVEHISPQTPQVAIDTNVVSPEVLNSFGNLALVSRSINSEYGNKPYNEKRQHFKNRNVNSVDSLKMDLIYDNQSWNDNLAIDHQNKMIQLLESHLKEDQIESV
jgi:hypothetical protein